MVMMAHATNQRLIFVLTCLSGVALAVPAALAQDALGDGTALDSSLRVGSGGRNPDARDFRAELAYRNAIVTGNVSGGSAFRGDVGYSAVNDFRGATGADDIFDFQRDAFLSGLATRGISGISSIQSSLAYGVTGQSNGLIGDVIINRPSSGLSSGDLPRPSGPRTDIYAIIGGTLRSPSAITLQELERPSFMNTVQDQGGNTIGYVGASDLLGVRALPPSNAMFGATDPTVENDIIQRLRTDPTLTQPDPNEPAEPLTTDVRLPSYEALLQSLGIPTRIEDTINTRIDPSAPDAAPLEIPLNADPLAWVREALRAAEDRANPLTRLGLDRAPDAVEPEPEFGTPDGEPEASEPTLQERIDLAIDAAERVLGRPVDMKDFGSGSDDPSFRRHFDHGVEMLEAGRYFDAEERFAAALQLSPGDPMAALGRLHAQIGAGMFLSAGANLRNLFVAYPELIAARVDKRFAPSEQRLADIMSLLRSRMDGATMMNADAAVLLAYMGVQTGNRQDIVDGLARYKALARDPDTDQPETFALLLEAAWLNDDAEGAGDEDTP